MSARYLSAVAVAAAVLAMLTAGPLRERLRGKVAKSALIAAYEELEFRPIEARVHGIPYRALPPLARADEIGDPSKEAKWRLFAAASEIEARATRLETRESLRALGAAHLMTGDPETAVHTYWRVLQLETGPGDLRDVIVKSRDAEVLSDLAAALYERNRRSTHSPLDLLLAGEASARAWSVRRAPEVAWNRALITTALQIPGAVAEAWNDYLDIDPSSEWAAEATLYRNRLASRPAAPSRSRWEMAILNAIDRNLPLREVVTAAPQLAREWLEEDAFRSWARAVLAGDAAAAALWSNRIEAAATALAEFAGDTLARDEWSAITATDSTETLRRAAEAHIDYAAGRELYTANRVVDSIAPFERAATGFGSIGFPFVNAVRVALASCEYLRRNAKRVETLAISVLNDPTGGGSLSLTGRSHWLLGLSALQYGDPRDSVAHFDRAVKAFRKCGEMDHEAAVSVQLAQAQDTLSLGTDSWKNWLAVFARYDQITTLRWRHGVTMAAAMAAVRDGYHRTAEALLTHSIKINTQGSDDVGAVAAYRWRGMLHHAEGDAAATAVDLRAARAHAGRIPDPALRAEAEAHLQVADAIVAVSTRPQSALSVLPDVRREAPRGTLFDRTDVHVTYARALAGSGGNEAARKALLASIDDLEERISRSPRVTQPASPLVLRPLVTVYDQAVLALLVAGEAWDALHCAERARAMSRRVNGQPGTERLPARSDVSKLPPDVVVWSYFVVGDDVVSWSLRRGEVKAFLSRGVVDRIRAIVSQSRSLDDPKVMTELRALVVGPKEEHSAGASVVVVVPDGIIWSVPFAALRAGSGRVLIQDHELRLANSLADVVADRDLTAVKTDRVVVAIGADPPEDFKTLPGADRETAAILRLFDRAGQGGTGTASRDDLAALAESADIVHFAGHAVFNAAEPRLSYLVLGRAESRDSRVYARDIRTWSLKREPLVVLAACQTAVNRGIHLDGSASVTDAFFDAGAGHVIASVRPVPDADGQRLFTIFYEILIRAATPPAALRAAQLELLEAGAPASAWASYAYFLRTI